MVIKNAGQDETIVRRYNMWVRSVNNQVVG